MHAFGLGAATHGNLSGTHYFEQAKGPQHVEQAVDFVFGAGDFNGKRLGGHVDDARAENVGKFEDLRALLGRGRHFDESQVANDGLLAGNVVDQENVHEFVDVGHDAPGLV